MHAADDTPSKQYLHSQTVTTRRGCACRVIVCAMVCVVRARDAWPGSLSPCDNSLGARAGAVPLHTYSCVTSINVSTAYV